MHGGSEAASGAGGRDNHPYGVVGTVTTSYKLSTGPGHSLEISFKSSTHQVTKEGVAGGWKDLDVPICFPSSPVELEIRSAIKAAQSTEGMLLHIGATSFSPNPRMIAPDLVRTTPKRGEMVNFHDINFVLDFRSVCVCVLREDFVWAF